MKCVGIEPTNLGFLLKDLKQIAAKAPRFPSETEGFTYQDLPSYTITRFDVISRSVRGKVGNCLAIKPYQGWPVS